MLKMRGKLYSIGLALGLWATPGLALGAAPDLMQSVKSARYPLVLQKDHFAGAGAPVLQAALDGARFVALGEIHLTQQVPAFATALCAAMAPHGLSGMAIEVGPEAARVASAAMRGADPVGTMAAWLHRYPNAAAFLDMREEIQLTARCAQAGGPGFHLWGLDQEFLGSAGMLLDAIAAETLTPAARAAVDKLRGMQAADAKAAAADGDMSKLFLFAAPEAALREAAAALNAGGSARANALFAALRESRAIYLAHGKSAAAGNRARGLLLKHTLLADLNAAGVPVAQQRVLVKFGDSHLYRGINDLHQPDLGNFLSELADANGVSSLHISVLGVRGTARRFGGYLRPAVTEKFALADDPDARWLAPLLAAAYKGQWTLFDLRALRFKHLTEADTALDRFVYGYDFLVLAPEITPAEPL